MKWLGIRADDVHQLDLDGSPFSLRDQGVLTRLIESPFAQQNTEFHRELLAMRSSGVKVELQALHKHGLGFMQEWLVQKLLTCNFVL